MADTVADSRAPDSVDPADLDHAATTPVRSEVREAMAAFLGERYGNPSGAHGRARDALRAVDEARERVASLVGCRPGEVIFTSGGTEADNHAITGGMPPRPGRPVCTAVEHHAVLNPVEALGGRTVGVDASGRVDLDDLSRAMDDVGPDLSVVSVMLANNEIGTVNDLAGVADVIDRLAPGVPLHTDAVQGAAWLDLSSAAARASFVSLSAHKLGGPKGVGVLVVREPVEVRPLVRGGSQERGRRGGTLNVAGIVGCATALEITASTRVATNERVRKLRDRLADGLVALDGVTETVVGPGGDRDHLVAGICHLTIDGVDSESLLFLLDADGVLASAASSCQSGAQQASHVMTALGRAGGRGDRASLRLSLGWDSTEADVDRALAAVPAAVERIRSYAPSGG